MSSAGGGVTSDAPQQYFCYQCNRTVTFTPSSDLVVCPDCNGGFIMEVENPIPNNPHSLSFTYEFGSDDLPTLFGGRSSPFGDADAFNPLVFLQNYIQTLRAGGANVQFVIDNSGDPSGTFRLPTNLNLGDYFFGPGLEQLIQHLAENDPNRYGTPPASKSAIEGLPNISITEELLASDSSQCAVCKDTFELRELAKQMPCKHIYHSDCILPWLELHNSCPVCRHELPTDDPDYEQRAPENRGQSVGVGAADSFGESPREQRFRVPLPWPFRQFSSVAETSNVRNANNSQNSDGESNCNFESETRQEDLD
ncbi:E3 ubiquitin-protein ligase RING1-like [Gastrolobium bilobum]|uniref:E3 ubiquitin-protein ligase RING1-like n=1 Tax=Gastrolobium bilobum TaxID=150636 RepID=UPI002AAF1702|nr:E3 ubiquitin-protein ligase RING1-like [Gastrolobium bilobum]XP_061367772.1 E3 ubiquitin-protein ligase RING1-like [Gastrolobium bilobum]